MKKHILIIVSFPHSSNTYIVGCFNDHCFMTPFYISVCLWGTSYVLLACLSLLSQPPAPIPLLHCLFSVGILFWLNGHKHKLSISSNSWSSAWQMKITLAKELFTSSKPCSGSLVQRKPEWKVKSAICPPAPIVCIKRTFISITTSSQEKQGTGFRLLTSFQNENKTAFNLFTLLPTQ